MWHRLAESMRLEQLHGQSCVASRERPGDPSARLWREVVRRGEVPKGKPVSVDHLDRVRRDALVAAVPERERLVEVVESCFPERELQPKAVVNVSGGRKSGLEATGALQQRARCHYLGGEDERLI